MISNSEAPMWRRMAFRAFGFGGFFTLCATAWLLSTPSGIFENEVQSGYGMCVAQPSVFAKPLRWESDPAVADHICCNNEKYAEYFGYWRTVPYPMTLPKGETITFYDVATNKPLFRAPIGRTYSEFITESTHHGWPSFRDEEVIWENVKVLEGGETRSMDNTHLGHNLPDDKGNRYCINLVCVAGHDEASITAQ